MALLEKNPDLLNIQNKDNGATALHLAVYLGEHKIVETLLKEEADLSIGDNCGWLPLHMAASRKCKEIVALLLRAGADPNGQGVVDKCTPLHVATYKGHYEIVKLLLAAGADPNRKDVVDECTPLHVATYKGHYEIVKLLLAAGADPDIVEKYGKTPLDIAKKRGKNSTVKILKQAEEG